MDGLLIGSVASLYVAGVVGVHRLNVSRRRRTSNGFPTLDWLHWDTLLAGLLPSDAQASSVEPPGRVSGGGPWPTTLTDSTSLEHSRKALLTALVTGHSIDLHQCEAVGLRGAQLRWVSILSDLTSHPELALEKLDASEPTDVAELYLREHLFLAQRIHSVNLELGVFTSKRQIARGLKKFGEHPALYFVRAKASALLGFNQSAIDNLARAVYYSRESRFFVRAVVEAPFIEEARPALYTQCKRLV